MPAMKRFRVGDCTVTRIPELLIPDVPASALLPDWDGQMPADDAGAAEHCNAEAGTLTIAVHAWLLQMPQHTVLIDTGAGNGKARPDNALFDRLDTPWLTQLQEAGVRAEDVDLVINTHLHVDHVGWNTVLRDGVWTPTFPNASYVFSGPEYDYYSDEAHVKPASHGVFADSVAPIMQAGLARRIDRDDEEVVDGLRLHRTPGHSFDHLSVVLQRGNDTALFAGDLMHHPVQVGHPGWNSVYCEIPAAARASRAWALDFVADHDAWYFSSHFAGSSAGKVKRTADGFAWQQA